MALRAIEISKCSNFKTSSQDVGHTLARTHSFEPVCPFVPWVVFSDSLYPFFSNQICFSLNQLKQGHFGDNHRASLVMSVLNPLRLLWNKMTSTELRAFVWNTNFAASERLVFSGSWTGSVLIAVSIFLPCFNSRNQNIDKTIFTLLG